MRKLKSFRGTAELPSSATGEIVRGGLKDARPRIPRRALSANAMSGFASIIYTLNSIQLIARAFRMKAMRKKDGHVSKLVGVCSLYIRVCEKEGLQMNTRLKIRII